MTDVNPLRGWTVDRAAIRSVGHDLRRPECILAERDGSLWIADARGGVVHIAPDGAQQIVSPSLDAHFDLSDPEVSLLRGTLPNGLAFAPDGGLVIANFGTDSLDFMSRAGVLLSRYDQIDGQPLGKVNFVLRDSRDRYWLTISTRVNPWSDAMNSRLADGYIALFENGRFRSVADGLHFANEIRFDADERWLYVAETTGKRVSRLRFDDDAKLLEREIYGPASLGTGLIDGIAFDAAGNLWATMIFADRLVAITPDRDVLTLLDDGDAVSTEAFEQAFATGRSVSFDILNACGGPLAPWLASVTFGGPNLRTVHLGSLKGSTLPTFEAPVAGLPMRHWSAT